LHITFLKNDFGKLKKK